MLPLLLAEPRAPPSRDVGLVHQQLHLWRLTGNSSLTAFSLQGQWRQGAFLWRILCQSPIAEQFASRFAQDSYRLAHRIPHTAAAPFKYPQ